jgi:guanosine-3',5'-bis(diphosphate) 3'-pyrophosphohydrolase
MAFVLRAARFAAERHSRQRRLDAAASPYINHPLALAQILSEADVGDSVVLAAALLHDTVEDTETTLAEVEALFGPQVAGIVAEVTDDGSLPKAERKRLQVANAPHKSTGAKLVKLSDKIANLRDIAAEPPVGWSADRRRAYFDWAAEVVSGLRGENETLDRLFDQAFAERERIT